MGACARMKKPIQKKTFVEPRQKAKIFCKTKRIPQKSSKNVKNTRMQESMEIAEKTRTLKGNQAKEMNSAEIETTKIPKRMKGKQKVRNETLEKNI